MKAIEEKDLNALVELTKKLESFVARVAPNEPRPLVSSELHEPEAPIVQRLLARLRQSASQPNAYRLGSLAFLKLHGIEPSTWACPTESELLDRIERVAAGFVNYLLGRLPVAVRMGIEPQRFQIEWKTGAGAWVRKDTERLQIRPVLFDVAATIGGFGRPTAQDLALRMEGDLRDAVLVLPSFDMKREDGSTILIWTPVLAEEKGASSHPDTSREEILQPIRSFDVALATACRASLPPGQSTEVYRLVASFASQASHNMLAQLRRSSAWREVFEPGVRAVAEDFISISSHKGFDPHRTHAAWDPTMSATTDE